MEGLIVGVGRIGNITKLNLLHFFAASATHYSLFTLHTM